MRASDLGQLLIIGIGAILAYKFVRVAIDGERRRVCSPLCGVAPHYADYNRLAPDFDLPALGGGRVRLSEQRGKVVILNFWTKTCGPCLEEMPSLAELGWRLAGRSDIVLLTISTDPSFDDVRATLRSVLGKEPPFAVLLDPEAAVVTGKFGTRLFPETWYIDPRGVIRARVDGARDWSEPVMLGLAESLKDRRVCEVRFRQGRPSGRDAVICDPWLGAQLGTRSW